MIRIINNKKVDVTDAEWQMYQGIVKSYTTTNQKGEDLFVDLFESDEDGIIIFLKPPSQRRISFEIFLFLMALMQHQHLRLIHSQMADVKSQFTEKMKEIDELKFELQEKIKNI